MELENQPQSLYPQPRDGGDSQQFGEKEIVGYLPGTSVRIWYTHLDESYPMHWHTAMEIIVGEKGYYEMVVDQQTYLVKADEFLIIPSGIPHSLTPHEHCNGFVYFLDASILNFVQSSASIMPVITRPIYITATTNPKLHLAVGSLLRQMRREYFSENEMRELFFYSHFLEIAAEIGRHSSSLSETLLHIRSDKRKEYRDKFNEIIHYINQNYTNELTIEGVSKQFGFSKFHFSRLFKQYTQFTFCEYLSFQRLKAAEFYLSQPEMSITDIAFQSGFSSLSTFSRVFKQQKNCTPSEYREIYVKEHIYNETAGGAQL